MELTRTFGEKIADARQLEKDGQLADAARIYQPLFNSNPGTDPVTGRLLVIYRKLKDYRKELSILNDAIAAYEQRQKAKRREWIQLHPKAAAAGRSILRKLEKGSDASNGLSENPVVERWIKRKAFVTARITGKKIKRVTKASKGKQDPAAQKKAEALQRSQAAADRKKVAQQRKEAARQREEAAKRKKEETLERIAMKKEEQAQKKAEGARIKAEAERKKNEKQRHPSLFVVLIRYLVSTDKIDAMMKQHMAYLNKHYKNGDFLVSGRQIPRTGGIILARGRDRNAVSKIVMQDPFVKHELASVDIIEFTASQSGKGLEKLFLRAL